MRNYIFLSCLILGIKCHDTTMIPPTYVPPTDDDLQYNTGVTVGIILIIFGF